MVIDDLLVRAAHQTVEQLGSEPLEERIGLAFLPYPIYDVTSLLNLSGHVNNDLLVILQVGIDGNHRITSVDALLHSCPKGVLMTAIVG